MWRRKRARARALKVFRHTKIHNRITLNGLQEHMSARAHACVHCSALLLLLLDAGKLVNMRDKQPSQTDGAFYRAGGKGKGG